MYDQEHNLLYSITPFVTCWAGLAGWQVGCLSHYNNLRMYGARPNHDYHYNKRTSIASKVIVRTISDTICCTPLHLCVCNVQGHRTYDQ